MNSKKPILAQLVPAGALLLAASPAGAPAAEMAEPQVRAAVQTWVRHVTADARPKAVIARMEPHLVPGQTAAYVAHLQDGGFCLCGADSLVLPVYWYSPKGTFDPANPGLRFILKEIAGRLDYLRQNQASLRAASPATDLILSKRAEFWADLSAGRASVRLDPPEPGLASGYLVLPLSCQWSQDPPYNDQCPDLPLGSGNRTVVGCVATAISQIMYYWRWPATGVGTGSTDYQWRRSDVLCPSAWLDVNPRPEWGDSWVWTNGWDTASNKIGGLEYIFLSPPGRGSLSACGHWDASLHKAAKQISNNADYRWALDDIYNRLIPATTTYTANFGATTYDWSLLSDRQTTNSGAAQNAELARLCLHVGIAVQMNYGLSESASNPLKAEAALQDHFRYDPDASVWTRNVDEMAQELDWLRPVQLNGVEDLDPATSGHAWVVLGYNKNTDPWQFWMNLGWGGLQDGWYSVDQIKYKELQVQLTRIAPLTVKFVGAPDAGDGSPDDPYQDIREAAAEAPSGSTLIFKAASVNTFAGSTLRMDRPMTLKSMKATIRHE